MTISIRKSAFFSFMLYSAVLSRAISVMTPLELKNNNIEQVWGPENGWSRDEIGLLAEVGVITSQIYTDEEYIENITNSVISDDYKGQYMPQGWFSIFKGKSVVVSRWKAPDSSGGGDRVSYDSLSFATTHISSTIEWEGGREVVDIHFNSEELVDSVLIDNENWVEFDRLTYKYEDRKYGNCITKIRTKSDLIIVKIIKIHSIKSILISFV